MIFVLAKEVYRGELPVEDAVYIWLDAWEYRIKRAVCRVSGHVLVEYGDNYSAPIERWCDRCKANLL